MLVRDKKGNELLEIIALKECKANELYSPVTHALGVVKVGDDYLLGWNKWRQDWEIFGGCREEGETIRACMEREGMEELGLAELDWTFLGLMHLKMAPGYFNPAWHEEYGGLFGVSLPKECLAAIERARRDREEVERISLYRTVKGKEEIAVIDEKLLEYWQETPH